MKNDWLNPNWHIHHLDVILEGYEKIVDKLKDDEKLKVMDEISKCIKLKRKIMNTMT